jgi:hypothetical protein
MNKPAKLISKHERAEIQTLSFTNNEIAVLFDALIISQSNAREQIGELSELSRLDAVTAAEWNSDIATAEGIKEQIKARESITEGKNSNE